MFHRKILSELSNWASDPHRKPLILRGARQVGKTTIVESFAKEFDTFLSLNLEKSEDCIVFAHNHSAQDVLTAVYLLKNKLRKKGRTLLFIDEIQNSPEAVKMLRYFYEDIPDLYVIAAGSLLETLIDKQISFPVGRVEYMALRPCSFGEFLYAMGETQLAKELLNANLPPAIHNHVMKLFNEYVLVGGMPEAVALYAERRDIVALQKVYNILLTGYQDDTEKYAANATQRNVLRHILMNGWRYGGERIKFEGFANSNYKSREMGEAFRLLEKAMLLELSYPTTSTELPLFPDFKKSPKLLWLDTGILNHVAGLQKELFGSQDISNFYRGKIAEHIVGQNLLAASFFVSEKRNFWVRNERNSQAETDFVVQYGDVLVPIEIKSGNTAKLKSLHLFMEASLSNVAVRFWNSLFAIDNIVLPSGKKYLLLNIPFYYAECLEKMLEKHSPVLNPKP